MPRCGPKSHSLKEEEEVEEGTNVSHQSFKDVLDSLQGLKSYINTVSNKVKNLEKSVNKKMRKLEKEAKKNRLKGNRKASGFAVPGKISKELCLFMKKEEGAEVARTEVTKYIIKYIEDNKLKNPANKKEILPDNALKSLLDIKNPKDGVTYFNIQKYMNKHFLKQ